MDHSFAVLAAAAESHIHNRRAVGKSVGGQVGVVLVVEEVEHILEEYILVQAVLVAAVVDHTARTAAGSEEAM